MAQGIKRRAAKPDKPSSTSTTSLSEGEEERKQLLQVVPSLSHVLCGMCSALTTHQAHKQVTSQVTQTCWDFQDKNRGRLSLGLPRPFMVSACEKLKLPLFYLCLISQSPSPTY